MVSSLKRWVFTGFILVLNDGLFNFSLHLVGALLWIYLRACLRVFFCVVYSVNMLAYVQPQLIHGYNYATLMEGEATLWLFMQALVTSSASAYLSGVTFHRVQS